MACKQDPNLQLSKLRRWIIFSIGLLDSALFGGTVFGWPQLVYVLKSEGIYSNLCSPSNPLSLTTISTPPDSNLTFVFEESSNITLPAANSRCQFLNASLSDGLNVSDPGPFSQPCPQQDERFALIYTLAVLFYGVPGIAVGFLLHYVGLRFTKLMAGSMISLSFVFLAITSEASPNWLFPSILLLSFGGNATRLSVMQFGDLFPKYRSTAITMLSGIYAASAAVFVLFDIFAGIGVSRIAVCYALAVLAGLSALSSLMMPIHHIPFKESTKEDEVSSDPLKPQERVTPTTTPSPLRESLLSWSSWLHIYWFFIGLFCVNNYQQSYNVWITATTCSKDELSLYSSYFSYMNLISMFVSPFGGYFTDFMIKRARKNSSSEISFRTKEIQANFFPLFVTTLGEISMYGSLLFFHPAAIYISLFSMLIVRPCLIACSTAYLRIRFPGTHFTRLLGIYSTTASALLFLQYPHFQWAQHQYYLAHSVALLLITASLSNPIHLLVTPLIRRNVIARDHLKQSTAKPGSLSASLDFEQRVELVNKI